MGTVTVSDPEIHSEKNVDSNGRIYIGKEYSDMTVQLTIKVQDEE